jgi:hypothetical protein
LNAAGEAPAVPAELLVALEAQGSIEQERHDAIARYLSASDGWKDAMPVLSGAFAADIARAKVKGC